MASDPDFPNLEAAAAELGERTGDLTAPELRRLLCLDCDFYTEDHEDDLECSCYRILRLLIAGKQLTPAGLREALASARQARRGSGEQ